MLKSMVPWQFEEVLDVDVVVVVVVSSLSSSLHDNNAVSTKDIFAIR
jgi:hypothetical protein